MQELVRQNLESITDEFKITNPTLQGMHREADNIQAFVANKANLDDAPSLPYRLNEMDAYLARVSDMQIRAKAMKEYAKTTFLIENEDKLAKMTATNSNRIISTYLYEFTITSERLDSLYDLLSLSCRNLITQISYIKKQMEMR